MTLLWPTTSEVIAAGGSYLFDRGRSHVPRFHQGDDIRVPVGTPIYASGDGVVTGVFNTGRTAGYGLYVQAQYGSVQVRTAHHSRVDVVAGQRLTSATQLGLSGGLAGTFGAGDATGPHCHLEVHVNGALSDPKLYLASRSSGASLKPIQEEDDDMTAYELAQQVGDPAQWFCVDRILRYHLADAAQRDDYKFFIESKGQDSTVKQVARITSFGAVVTDSPVTA